jgi:hypothetical protein
MQGHRQISAKPESHLREAAEDASLVDEVGEFLETHVGEGEIVVDGRDLGGEGAEFAAAVFEQINDEQRVVGFGHGERVGDHQKGVGIILRKCVQQLAGGRAGELAVVEQFQVEHERLFRLLEGGGEGIPGGLVGEIGADDERGFGDGYGFHGVKGGMIRFLKLDRIIRFPANPAEDTV